MRAKLLIASVLAVGFTATAKAQQPPAVSDQPRATITRDTAPDTSQSKSVTPETFATQAAQMSAAEVELGKLALHRAQDPQILQYAKKMISEHSAQTEKLTNVAQQYQIALPNDLSAHHQALKQKLSGLHGAQFDEEYAQAMAASHDEAVALFESASQAPQLPGQLKEFAAANLTKLKEHRDMANALPHQK